MFLCSYVATSPGSVQYDWLKADLAAVDRSRTPWLLVIVHAPWYNSYVSSAPQRVVLFNRRTFFSFVVYVHVFIGG